MQALDIGECNYQSSEFQTFESLGQWFIKDGGL